MPVSIVVGGQYGSEGKGKYGQPVAVTRSLGKGNITYVEPASTALK